MVDRLDQMRHLRVSRSSCRALKAAMANVQPDTPAAARPGAVSEETAIAATDVHKHLNQRQPVEIMLDVGCWRVNAPAERGAHIVRTDVGHVCYYAEEVLVSWHNWTQST